MTWWKSADGDWVNGSVVPELEAFQLSTGSWVIVAKTSLNHSAGTGQILKGFYASKNEAQKAASELCQGIDPRTVTGGS